jgi:hypothetical protein
MCRTHTTEQAKWHWPSLSTRSLHKLENKTEKAAAFTARAGERSCKQGQSLTRRNQVARTGELHKDTPSTAAEARQDPGRKGTQGRCTTSQTRNRNRKRRRICRKIETLTRGGELDQDPTQLTAARIKSDRDWEGLRALDKQDREQRTGCWARAMRSGRRWAKTEREAARELCSRARESTERENDSTPARELHMLPDLKAHARKLRGKLAKRCQKKNTAWEKRP